MNISESDLPVRPIEAFEAHLASRMGRNFVAYSKNNMVTFHDGQGLSKVTVRKFVMEYKNLTLLVQNILIICTEGFGFSNIKPPTCNSN